MSCKHYWLVDRCNVGTCKYCGEVRDFQPAIDKTSGEASSLEHPLRHGVSLDRFLNTKADYYMQGGLPVDISRRLG